MFPHGNHLLHVPRHVCFLSPQSKRAHGHARVPQFISAIVGHCTIFQCSFFINYVYHCLFLSFQCRDRNARTNAVLPILRCFLFNLQTRECQPGCGGLTEKKHFAEKLGHRDGCLPSNKCERLPAVPERCPADTRDQRPNSCIMNVFGRMCVPVSRSWLQLSSSFSQAGRMQESRDIV
jgi:hypothetical protein